MPALNPMTQQTQQQMQETNQFAATGHSDTLEYNYGYHYRGGRDYSSTAMPSSQTNYVTTYVTGHDQPSGSQSSQGTTPEPEDHQHGHSMAGGSHGGGRKNSGNDKGKKSKRSGKNH